jgi:predicted nucleotidyltransferase
VKIPEATKTELDKIVRRVVDVYRPEKIILFGSYAYGRPSADSDLDLLIIKKTSERFIDRWTNVRKIVSDPKRSIPFEPLVLTPQEVKERLAIGDQFIEEIIYRGEVLYTSE